MHRLWQTLLNYFLLLGSDWPSPTQDPLLKSIPDKSILIIGGGSAGLSVLKTLLDLPKEIRGNWEISLYEQRHDIGGIWLPDPDPPHPPILPETPLYPSLHTNAPVPLMTWPDFPYPAGTPLFPSHEHIHAYQRRYASHFHLAPHIYLNHTVLSTSWVGTSSHGHWNVTTKIRTDGSVFDKRFDHLIVAIGHNQYPYSPTWDGVEGWLDNTPPGCPKREILHSIYYRTPEPYRGRTVLVIGNGGSGADVAAQIAPLSKKIYQSVGEHHLLPVEPPAIEKPRISHFTNTSIIFVDGTSVSSVDSIILGTGYEKRVPFLSDGGALIVNPSARSPLNSSAERGPLTTNLRYIRPLYKQLVSLSSSFPPTAFYIVGLPVVTADCPTGVAQTLFIIDTILNPRLLPPRSELLAELRQHEQILRDRGYDPDDIGHKLVDDKSLGNDYQEEIVQWLRERGAPLPFPFRRRWVENWRRVYLHFETYVELRNAWKRVRQLGEEDIQKWVGGLESERDWASMMGSLLEWWEKEKEKDMY